MSKKKKNKKKPKKINLVEALMNTPLPEGDLATIVNGDKKKFSPILVGTGLPKGTVTSLGTAKKKKTIPEITNNIIDRIHTTLAQAITEATQGLDISTESNAQLCSPTQGKRKLILHSPHAPGDVTMLTTAIRDLHKTYPNEYLTDIDTTCNDVFENNPYITKLNKHDQDTAYITMEYPLIHNSNKGSYHFIHGYRKFLETQIGRKIIQGDFKPDIHIGEEEKQWFSAVREITMDNRLYWIIDAGFKNDFTAKAWPAQRYQEVVDHFKDKIQFVQIGHKDHNHPKLKGVINLVGKTDNRQLIRLVFHSIGVLTPVSWPMVLAAAVPMSIPVPRNRSCVVIAGGREPMQWQAYPNHQFIHTCGSLVCCDEGGCWKSRVVPIGDGDLKDKENLCEAPTKVNDQDIATCMDMITTDMVINAIDQHYNTKVGVHRYMKEKTVSYDCEDNPIYPLPTEFARTTAEMFKDNESIETVTEFKEIHTRIVKELEDLPTLNSSDSNEPLIPVPETVVKFPLGKTVTDTPPVDTPNANGTVYTKEVVDKALGTVPEKVVLLHPEILNQMKKPLLNITDKVLKYEALPNWLENKTEYAYSITCLLLDIVEELFIGRSVKDILTKQAIKHNISAWSNLTNKEIANIIIKGKDLLIHSKRFTYTF